MSLGKHFSSGKHCRRMTISDCPTACMPFVVKHQHFLFTSARMETCISRAELQKGCLNFTAGRQLLRESILQHVLLCYLSHRQITSYICYRESKHIQNKSSSIIPSLQLRKSQSLTAPSQILGLTPQSRLLAVSLFKWKDRI